MALKASGVALKLWQRRISYRRKPISEDRRRNGENAAKREGVKYQKRKLWHLKRVGLADLLAISKINGNAAYMAHSALAQRACSGISAVSRDRY